MNREAKRGITYPKTYPKNQTKLFVIKVAKKNYTIPKLHIPKDKSGRATTKKEWYVWFNFRNPETGKFDNKSKVKRRHEINRYKTVAGRRKWGNELVEKYTIMLSEGYNPFDNTLPAPVGDIDFSIKEMALEDSILKALKDKKLSWSNKTYESTEYRVREFLKFTQLHGFSTMKAHHIQRNHVTEFLNTLKERGLSLTSVNNYRNVLSGIFGQMVANGDLDFNPCLYIKKEKTKPVKNHPFTNKQAKDLSDWLSKNDPYLLTFIRVFSYSFLRNREVLSLRVRDVDLKNRLISSETKTQGIEKVFIIDQLLAVFKEMKLHKYQDDDFVFSSAGHPGPWKSVMKTKKKYFSDRFRPAKKHFKFGREYTIYSFRHTFAVNLFDHFISQGDTENQALQNMMRYTRHRSIEMASNYVREKRQMLPQDYSEKISLDF